MTLDRLILNDFLTYEFLDYTFENKPLLIQGLNLTDDGQVTNGTGKSGLQTGIEQCITASNSRGVRDSEIITYGKKQARCQLYASCNIRKQSLHIDWEIKITGSNVLRLKTKEYDSDHWVDVSFSNVADGKKAIMDWFAISREDLFNYYVVNNTQFKSFFKSSNTDKVALINRFSDASIIDGIEQIDLTKINAEHKAASSLVDGTKGTIDFLKTSILKEQSRNFTEESEFEKQKLKAEIENVNYQIDALHLSVEKIRLKTPSIEIEIKENEEQKSILAAKFCIIESNKSDLLPNIKKVGLELDEAQSLVDDFKAKNWVLERKTFQDDVLDCKNNLKPLNESKQGFESQEKKIIEILHKVDISLSGKITCPKCSHDFILDDDIDALNEKKVKVSELREVVKTNFDLNEIKISDLKDKILSIESDLSDINQKEGIEIGLKQELNSALQIVVKKLNFEDAKMKGFEQEIRVNQSQEVDREFKLSQLKVKLSNVDLEIESVTKEIQNKNNKIELLKVDIDSLELGNNLKQISDLKSDLKIKEIELIEAEKKFNKIGDEIYLKNQWIQNFKQFKMFLANQSLGVIEYHCNRYLDEMGSDLTIKMEGFKMLANGTTKEEINVVIIRNIERTFSSFSGGERGRLLFASILANRHMINETNPYGGLDFLAVDEVFEGVDGAGIVSLIESAKLLSMPVMIITHVAVEETENVLTIVKEKGISKIK
jgi:exonuclease SbcC